MSLSMPVWTLAPTVGSLPWATAHETVAFFPEVMPVWEAFLPFFPLISKNVLVRFFMVYRLSTEDRQRATALLNDWLLRGMLKHNIGERFPLDQVAAAHSMLEQGKAVGNVVLAIE